jgi:hypothetical protein
MSVACYVDYGGKHAREKVLRAFAEGCGGTVVFYAEPSLKPGITDHVIMGMWETQNRMIELVLKSGQNLWYLDNGWWVDIWKYGRRGVNDAYYRVSQNGMAPKFLPGVSFDRAKAFGVKLEPWRTDGRHVLVCLQFNPELAKGFGFNYGKWKNDLKEYLPTVTDRPIVYRQKPRDVTKIRPLAEAMKNAWCVVTHSSNAAVEAAMAGVPVFCDPSCGAAMVGCTDFSKIEEPVRPDNRKEWISSLMWQQFSVEEFRSGLAWRVLNNAGSG